MIADLTKKYIGEKYELGKVDCFRLIYDYLKDKIDLPKEFNGITLENYADLFLKNPNDARNFMVLFLKKYLNEVASNKIYPGDIVVLSYNYGPIFLGIMVADANAFIITIDDGAMIVPLKYYQIKRVFRCPV